MKNTSLPDSVLSKRHNAINYNVVREAVAAGIISVGKEDGQTNLADAFTRMLLRSRRFDLFSRIAYSSMFMGNVSGKRKAGMEQMERSGQPEARKPRLIAKTDMRHAMPHGDRLKPSDDNEKREKKKRAGQLPGPGKREQVPGKWERGIGLKAIFQSLLVRCNRHLYNFRFPSVIITSPSSSCCIQHIHIQKQMDEYRNMAMEGMDLIPLESNLHKFHPVIISQIINMIKSDNFWHRKTFKSVMSDLWNMWTEGIRELENSRMYCTNNDKSNNEMDGVEVIDLFSVSQSKNDTLPEGKESAKQESWDKSKHDGMDKMEDELKTIKSDSTTKNN